MTSNLPDRTADRTCLIILQFLRSSDGVGRAELEKWLLVTLVLMTSISMPSGRPRSTSMRVHFAMPPSGGGKGDTSNTRVMSGYVSYLWTSTCLGLFVSPQAKVPEIIEMWTHRRAAYLSRWPRRIPSRSSPVPRFETSVSGRDGRSAAR